jgi:rhodanese-related sulfurtransferase
VLKLVCRVTVSPDSCVRQTENAFERYGVASLLVAKFIPGLARVAALLSGGLRIRLLPFLIYSGAGAALWAGSGLVLGLIFHKQVDWLLGRLAELGGLGLVVLAAVLAIYVAFRFVDRWRFLRSLRSARIGVRELYEMIAKGNVPVILDVRSAAQRRINARSIPGARAVDPERMEETLLTLPAGRDVIVHCACPNDATALSVALLLRKHGIHRVRPLAGDIDAWVEAGFKLAQPLADANTYAASTAVTNLIFIGLTGCMTWIAVSRDRLAEALRTTQAALQQVIAAVDREEKLEPH